MRFLAPSLALLLGLMLAPSARADYPQACQGGQCGDTRGQHPLAFWRSHSGAGHLHAYQGMQCGEEKPKSHSLFSFDWLRRHHDPCKACGHSHGKAGGCHWGNCGYHPWFHTFRTGPGPESAFPTHPFVRGPRDFFMYDW